jgi:phosphoribosylcarboxyaminoimidazole (NCAIR) mutase
MEILAVSDEDVAQRLEALRAQETEKVLAKNAAVEAKYTS